MKCIVKFEVTYLVEIEVDSSTDDLDTRKNAIEIADQVLSPQRSTPTSYIGLPRFADERGRVVKFIRRSGSNEGGAQVRRAGSKA